MARQSINQLSLRSLTWRSGHEVQCGILLVGEAQLAVVLGKPRVVLHTRRVRVKGRRPQVFDLLQS